jgi:hypothetical protein
LTERDVKKLKDGDTFAQLELPGPARSVVVLRGKFPSNPAIHGKESLLPGLLLEVVDVETYSGSPVFVITVSNKLPPPTTEEIEAAKKQFLMKKR